MFSRFLFRLLLVVSIVSIGVWYFFQPSPAQAEDKYVNVYCWYGLLDQETIKEFENETGITVRFLFHIFGEQLVLFTIEMYWRKFSQKDLSKI